MLKSELLHLYLNSLTLSKHSISVDRENNRRGLLSGGGLFYISYVGMCGKKSGMGLKLDQGLETEPHTHTKKSEEYPPPPHPSIFALA